MLEKNLNERNIYKIPINITAPAGLKLYMEGPVYYKEMCTAKKDNHDVVLAGHDEDNWII